MAESRFARRGVTLSEKHTTLTAVICTKNEAGTLSEVIEAVKPRVDSILVVDGHSSDGTRSIAEALGVEVQLDNRRGKGAAIRQAIDYLDCNVIVFIDADGSHDPADIPKFVQPILDDEADLVIGCRITGGSDELAGDWGSFARATGSQIINLIVNWRFRVRLTDIQNGYRAIRRTCAEDLPLIENVTTIEQEMTIKALKKEYRVINVPSHEYRRKVGISRISVPRLACRYVWEVIRDAILS